ncbi:hypothetical protein MSPP1_003519 [Malassezia sp. CBS 17886]|nr:hypothetical protein MSPP1_003519 [Malassezia sp. CBS 17886]
MLGRRVVERSNASPGELLDWYQARLQESRTRLACGSAESVAALGLLAQYASQRRDVAALRRLRKPAREHMLACACGTALVGAQIRAPLADDPAALLERIDNALFSIAAQQNDWDAMARFALARPEPGRWTPFMFRALLSTNGALDMIRRAPDAGGDDTRQQLWTQFLSAFSSLVRGAPGGDVLRAGDMGRAAFAPWLVLSLLDMYARAGHTQQASALVELHLQLNERKSSGCDGRRVVLRRRRAALLTAKARSIPGHLLLNRLVATYLAAGNADGALAVFTRLANVPLPALAGPLQPSSSELPPTAHGYTTEPDTGSVLLALDAVQARAHADGAACVRAMLAMVQSIDRRWGLFQHHVARPLFLDLRVMTRLLSLCARTDDRALGRRLLRFQEGLLRRELRWHSGRAAALTRDLRVLWRQSPNEFALLQRWAAVVARLVRGRWLSSRHAAALRAMARRVAEHQAASRTPLRRPARHGADGAPRAHSDVQHVAGGQGMRNARKTTHRYEKLAPTGTHNADAQRPHPPKASTSAARTSPGGSAVRGSWHRPRTSDPPCP